MIKSYNIVVKKRTSKASYNGIPRLNRGDSIVQVKEELDRKNLSSHTRVIFESYSDVFNEIITRGVPFQPLLLHVPSIFDLRIELKEGKSKIDHVRTINLYDDYLLRRLAEISMLNDTIKVRKVIDTFYDVFTDALNEGKKICFFNLLTIYPYTELGDGITNDRYLDRFNERTTVDENGKRSHLALVHSILMKKQKQNGMFDKLKFIYKDLRRES